MGERPVFSELFLATSREVQDTLTISDRVLRKRGLATLPVKFMSDSILKREQEEDLTQSMAVVSDFSQMGLPIEMFRSGHEYGLTAKTETGPEIHLSLNYFGDYLSKYQGAPVFSPYILTMFRAIAIETLRWNTQEIELTRDPEDLQLFIGSLINALNEGDFGQDASRKINDYVPKLQERLQSAAELRLVGVGDLLVLKDNESTYSRELAGDNLSSLIAMADLFSESFYDHIKRTPWFIPQESWPDQLVIQYKNSVKKLPRWRGGFDGYIADYLFGEMARKNLEFFQMRVLQKDQEANTADPDGATDQTSTMETEVTGPHPNPITSTEAISLPKKENPKQKQKRLYPKQRRKLEWEQQQQPFWSDVNFLVQALKEMHFTPNEILKLSGNATDSYSNDSE